jgi:hypothetical protein
MVLGMWLQCSRATWTTRHAEGSTVSAVASSLHFPYTAVTMITFFDSLIDCDCCGDDLREKVIEYTTLIIYEV